MLAESRAFVNPHDAAASASSAPPLSLSNAHIREQPSLTIALEGRLLVLRNPSDGSVPPPPGDRGNITEFSRQSRKRLMQLFAGVAQSAVRERSIFLTLTYHLDWDSEPGVWKSQLRLFIDGLLGLRPEAAVIWRLEFQNRGAPHWHLLVVNVSYLDQEWVSETWGRIAHGTSEYHGQFSTSVVHVASWYQACAYVSKEMGKVSQARANVQVGRYWGCENRKNLPRELSQFSLNPDQFARLRQLVLSRIPDVALSKWVKRGAGGLWSMIPGEQGLRMLAWALACDEPASSYRDEDW